MSRRYLGPLEVPSDSQLRSQTGQEANLATSPLLQGIASVEDISTEPGDYVLDLEFRGELADKLAAEAAELLEAPDINYVPFYSVHGAPSDGYYSIESLQSSRVDPRTSLQQSVRDARLVHKGSRGSSLRGVTTATSTLTHPFGNDESDVVVAVPDAASRTRWYDAATGGTEPATPTNVVEGEHGPVACYDPQSASYTTPTLVYDLDYGEAWRADVQLWDTRSQTKTDSSGNVLWQRCFSPAHDLQGAFVLDTRLCRLHLNPTSGSVSFEEWDTGSGAWSSVSLPSSSWSLVDVDVIEIKTPVVEAQLEFSNGSETYAVNAMAHRGRSRMLYHVPSRDTQGAMPSGLQDFLSPTASGSIVDVQPSQVLRDRGEVRA
ncbi:hypothetical protein U3A55_11945 [Salarchaeum sp. III]|uniref:hypothetical protein n=1 Tax=Salarchaeum sp. III TaxID=3107927 RepID=UPI002ED9E301